MCLDLGISVSDARVDLGCLTVSWRIPWKRGWALLEAARARAHTSCCNGCFNVSEHGKVRKRASCEDMIDMQAIHTIHSYTMHYYAILSRNFFKWYIERNEHTESCSRCCKSFLSDPCPFQGTWGLAQVVCPFLLRHGPFPYFGTSPRYSRCCTCCQVWESGLLKFNIIRSVVCVQAS